MNLFDFASFFFTNTENKVKIQLAFESSYGKGLFSKIRFILEIKDTVEFSQMNIPHIIMRKISSAVLSHFDQILATSVQQKNSLMLRDLCNESPEDAQMEIAQEDMDEIDKIFRDHKDFIESSNFNKNELHDQKIKKLFPQIWKTFTKEQQQYLAF